MCLWGEQSQQRPAFEASRHPGLHWRHKVLNHNLFISSSERARNSNNQGQSFLWKAQQASHCPPWASLPPAGKRLRQTVQYWWQTWNSALSSPFLKAGGSLPPGVLIQAIRYDSDEPGRRSILAWEVHWGEEREICKFQLCCISLLAWKIQA